MRNIDTKLLRSFLSVASERSFSLAADRLACSQATMSQRIRQLEDLLGIELFHRGYHKVHLTAAGSELLPHAQAVVDEHDNLLNALRKGQVRGSVRLGIAEDYVLPYLPKLLLQTQQVYPGIELSIFTGLSQNLAQQVDARNLDIAVITLPETMVRAHVISKPSLQWVTAPDFVYKRGEPLPMAFFPQGCAFRAAAEQALNANNIAFRESLVSASGQVIHSAVAASLAVTVMAQGTLPQDLCPLPDSAGLPSLPITHIQIIERNQGLSQAAIDIKELVVSNYR